VRSEAPTARVLVIDDERGIRDVFIHLLGGGGHRVVAAADGKAALSLIAAESFDIVFCDLMLTGMSGFAVLSTIQKSHKHLPVVVMTAYPTNEVESGAKMLGSFAFLPKPFEISAVERLIALALGSKKSG
jgi:DNA-binding NtrC family response regulator